MRSSQPFRLEIRHYHNSVLTTSDVVFAVVCAQQTECALECVLGFACFPSCQGSECATAFRPLQCAALSRLRGCLCRPVDDEAVAIAVILASEPTRNLVIANATTVCSTSAVVKATASYKTLSPVRPHNGLICPVFCCVTAGRYVAAFR